MGDSAFKDIINSSNLEHLASVYSPITARIARDAGFEYGIVGGSIASMALLGSPDLSLLTSTELVDFVRKISQSSDLDIIVDGDGGYGNALNAMRLVVDLEQAGARAVTLEDTALPIRYKETCVKLVAPEEHAAKLHSAVQARSSGSFGVIARTSVLKNESKDAVLERITLYSSTGVDAICVTQVHDINLLKSIAKSTDLPIMLISYNNKNLFSEQELSENRVRLHLCGHQPFEESVRASYHSYIKQRKNSHLSRKLSPKEIVSIYNNEERYTNLIKEFL